MRWIVLTVVVVVVATGVFLIAGRDSKSERAMAQVCDARADISKQVDSLKGLTPSSATTSQVSDGLQAIGDDLSTIADARGDLADENRDDVKAANDEFVATVRETASTVARTVSVEDAVSQLQGAVTKLAAGYRDTYGTVDCG